jgi:16S rRNA (uracil1498-N3)-methyltransferase
MARTDFNTPRLCVAAPLAESETLTLTAEQTNYLVNVLRLKPPARVLVFNGRDGEYAATLAAVSRKGATLLVDKQTRPQETPPDVDYLFAPLKHARLDYIAQKAVEMGARRLRPILTQRTQVSRVNIERLTANAIEACEQCGVIWRPEVMAPQSLEQALGDWPAERLLVFCDEDAPRASPLEALASARATAGVGLMIGPEGGFDGQERAQLLKLPHVLRLSLGPRVLRADTAAVAALALIQATLGDWPRRPAEEKGETSSQT